MPPPIRKPSRSTSRHDRIPRSRGEEGDEEAEDFSFLLPIGALSATAGSASVLLPPCCCFLGDITRLRREDTLKEARGG